jgi:PAS domain S-box-containing protein
MTEIAAPPSQLDDEPGRGAGSGEVTAAACPAALELSPAPMWAYDDETRRFLAVNDRALRHYGYSREQFLAMTVADLSLPASPQQRAVEACAAQAESGAAHAICQHRKADGTLVVARLEMGSIEIDGRPATLVIAIDVTRESQALAESERARHDAIASVERFGRLFETASDWYWEQDPKGALTFISANFEAMYGISIADALGKRLNEMSNSKLDPDSSLKALAAIKARQPFRDFLYSHSLPDGRTIQIRSSGIPMFDGNGQFRGYCGVAKDVTAQVEAEHALRASEQQVKQVLEAAADFYWEQDAKYRFTYVSPGLQDRLGFVAEDFVGSRLMDVPGMSSVPTSGLMVLEAIKAKQPYRDYLFTRTMPDGVKRWFKGSGAPVFDQSGGFKGYRGVISEITKQVEAEAAERLAQEHLQEAAAHATQAISVYDAVGKTMAYNQAFVDLHWRIHRHRHVGDSSEYKNPPTAVGIPFRDLAEWQVSRGFYANGSDHPAIDVETLLARYQSEEEHSYHLGDGSWLQMVYHRLPGGGRVGLWTDVTALKKAEAEKRALEAQLHHSQRLEALGTLAGGAAHEINNALVPTIALTKMVANKLPEGSRERRNLETAVSGAERSCELVKQILAFSRKEDAERPQGESVDVGAVLGDALKLMRATVPTSISLEQEIAPVPTITGDPSQLRQMIVNLVTNAAQAIGQAQGRITVTLRPEADGAQLRLSIADSGCGMDEATLARVFEPFFTTKPPGEGTGLGLSVAHGIVKAHGGRIEVTSAPGQGSRFDVFLPVPSEQATQAA